ncbi:LOW QUALITY PROTEIN: dynein regulatory complex subunit 5 [Colossoma macropomum]|uniref:LOW QUALITY PROTEIN: dynein regulatory complex subunit 5 n=1 Tax=Colossoma macropomum TaxID=42526 RepID=UPI00186447C6|nr:LOW QUALITY PROTEIN: dynein regulatory complex subunit 5 [Colossoma macropomum]
MPAATMSKGKAPAGIYPPIAQINPAADPRRMRRIIAEDPEWSLAVVPLLTNLCLQHIVKHFEERPILDELLPDQKAFVLEKLPQSLPLSVTANLISEECYWKRCCEGRWAVSDVSEYGHSWKRMFFERHLENIIELFIPDVTDPKAVLDVVPFCQNYVRRLKISQLLPPIKEPPKFDEDDASDSASDVGNDRPSMDHFDFRILLDKLTNLEELQLVYGVKGCGMNFEWNLFEFTFRDCEFLAKALKSCKSLKVLRINQSKVDDEKCRTLVSYLLDHPSLLELDLSHNLIGDRGARAIGKLLNRSRLEWLDIYDNQIQGSGAQALAHALSKNTSLLYFNLRLNRLGDEGGQAVAQALLKNSTLQNLNLGANELTEPTATALSHALVQNSTLRSLNLSCNRLGVDGGKVLEEGMSHNSSLLECDIRLTDVGLESEYCIGQVLRTNQAKARRKRTQDLAASK